MSTNYYIKSNDSDNPKNHLGKRVSIGNKKTKFVWATTLSFSEFFEEIKNNNWFDCVINEYGEELTISEFTKLILKCDKQDISNIGKEFS